MSSVKGVVRTLYDSTPRELVAPDRAHGVKQVIYDEYEASGLASGSTITVGVPVPKGARIANVTVMHDDLGTTAGTLEVGITGDTNRFLTAFATGSAGKQTMTGTYGDIDYWYYQTTADTDIIITTAGATISGTIKIEVEYVRV